MHGTPERADLSVHTEDYLNLVRALLSDSAAQRERAADDGTDWAGSYDQQQASALIHVLLCAAEIETSPSAVESELNAVCAIVGAGTAKTDFSALLARIDRSKLSGSAIEHLDSLMGESE
ncbi:hypothetical protein [Nocardia sp. IFM 10818]